MTIAKSPSHRANALVAHFACYYCDIQKINKNKTNSSRRLPKTKCRPRKCCRLMCVLAQENENSNIRRHRTGMKTCTHTGTNCALFAPQRWWVNLHLLVTDKSPSSLRWCACVSLPLNSSTHAQWNLRIIEPPYHEGDRRDNVQSVVGRQSINDNQISSYKSDVTVTCVFGQCPVNSSIPIP